LIYCGPELLSGLNVSLSASFPKGLAANFSINAKMCLNDFY
jgi:hypothetical protein